MQNSLGGQKSPDQFPCAGFYQNSRQMIAHILRKSHLNNPTVPFGTGPICAKQPPGRSGKLDLSPLCLFVPQTS